MEKRKRNVTNINDVLPRELLSIILQHAPVVELIRKCTLVCVSWKQVIHNKGFWVDVAHKLFGRGFKTDLFLNIKELQMLAVRRPIGRNLIKNPLALAGLNEWKIIENGGGAFAVQDEPHGSDSLLTQGYQQGEAKNWATSYGWCIKEQKIDLLKEGLTARFMDECRPEIVVNELVAGRFDCAAKYFLTVTLLDKSKQTVGEPKTEEFHVDQWLGRQWQQISMMLSDYGPGVRYINYQHGGKDKQFWAGHYGTKFTGASVVLGIKS